jgi:hypothetical protein
MKFYKDTEGVVVNAFQLTGSLVLNIPGKGEIVGSITDWAIYVDDVPLAIITNDQFIISFFEVV